MKKEEFVEELKKFDVYYWFSDDNRTYNNGKSQENNLRNLSLQVNFNFDEWLKQAQKVNNCFDDNFIEHFFKE